MNIFLNSNKTIFNKKMVSALIAILLLAMTSKLAYAEAYTGFSALVVEPKTGKVLYENAANENRYPASLTKIMTLYVVFEALKKGEVTLKTPVVMSANGTNQAPSKLGLKVGEQIPMDLAIRVLVVKSANDIAVALAETISGSESAFVERMNQTANRLGLSQTYFRNPHGLPNLSQKTSAWDLYKLSAALYNNFPEFYPYFQITEFTYNGKTTTTHNRVMTSYWGADGIKTGYIKASGFNLVTSAKRNNHHLIGVILGGRTATKRDDLMKQMLDQSFVLLDSGAGKNEHIQLAIDDNDVVGSDRMASAETEEEPTSYKPALKNKIDDDLEAETHRKLPVVNVVNKSKSEMKFSDSSVIQVGSFKDYTAAQNRARLAIRNIKAGKIKIEKNGNLYRALVIDIPSQKIETSCTNLRKSKIDCLVFSH